MFIILVKYLLIAIAIYSRLTNKWEVAHVVYVAQVSINTFHDNNAGDRSNPINRSLTSTSSSEPIPHGASEAK
jgi:hypothetical protein